MITLRLNNIVKKYSAKAAPALDNFSLTVNTGDIHAIVGESGCGKTTLLRLIAGLEIPNEGEIFVNEKLVSSSSVIVAPEKRNIGFVFQDYALFPHLTVNQNVGFGLGKLSAIEKKERIKKYITLVGMIGYEDRYPHELSGGQQQRIALARSLATEPSLLLLDEPFSNLDEILKKQMRFEIRNIISKAGATAIFVTHDTNDALAIANEITVLRRGNLLQTSTPETIFNNPINEYTARMFGDANILKGVCENGKLTNSDLQLSFKDTLSNGESICICVRPEDIAVSQTGANRGIITDILYAGNRKTLVVNCKSTEVLIASNANQIKDIGKEIYFDIKHYSIIRPD